MISKHISIDEEYFDRIKPYIEKHNGNLGAALREIINQVENHNCYTNVDTSLSDWIFKEAEGRLVSDSVINEMIDPNLINSMKKLDEYINERFNKSEWNININLEADNDAFPSYILVDIRGSSSKINVMAGILSKYLIRHSSERSPLGIKSVVTFDESIRIEFCMMDKKKALESLFTFFGYTDEVLNILKDKPTFWKTMIERHVNSNYNMITIHRNHFEELLANDIPRIGEITIEILTKKAIQDIPLKELLYLIKNVYENSRIVDKIEIDKHNMIVYHSYRNQNAKDKLKQILVRLLENGGHLYDAESTSNMTILRYMPDIDMKIDQIVSNLQTNLQTNKSNLKNNSNIDTTLNENVENNIDLELIKFVICLNGLKDIPDILYTSLGIKIGQIGQTLIQEYEKENNYNHDWDIEKFKKFFEEIDLKLHRISTWKSENGNVLYTIKKCNIAKCDKFNQYMCCAIREMFKGALNYALGDNTKLEIKKLLSHGDNSCEVIIRTK